MKTLLYPVFVLYRDTSLYGRIVRISILKWRWGEGLKECSVDGLGETEAEHSGD